MMYAHTTTHAPLIVEPLRASVSPDDAIVSFSRLREPAILESLIQPHTYARYSIFAFDPIDQFTAYASDPGCPFQQLADRSALYATPAADSVEIPFTGGWIGYFTYEAGLRAEKIITRTDRYIRDIHLPIAHFKLYDTAAVYDHNNHQWFAVAVDLPCPTRSSRQITPPERIQMIASLLHQTEPAHDACSYHTHPPATARANMTRKKYLHKVARAKAYIAAGDIFEVNLSQRFEVRVDATPEDIYRRLRAVNPSSHAAFLPWGELTVMSSSPELFLQLTGNHVVTRPIKGTRPRGCDDVADSIHHQALADSEKDRAELTMIIDLLRNDLGRVCEYASVNVRESAAIEPLPHVFHQVATVEGTLRKHCSWLDLLRATFPGGSITGAPKIRAMQIIHELEHSPRGVYCGSIGLIGINGNLSLNIAIRTIVQQANLVRFDAGGAIVADSDPQQEYEEIMAKVKGMMQALDCTMQDHIQPVQELTHA